MALNSWAFTGNLGRDAEQRFAGDKSVVSFSVGVKAGFGDKATTTWANCSLWGKQGESLLAYLTKGQLVGVVGEVCLREWTDKEGNKRQNLDVRVNDISLLGKRDEQKEAPKKERKAQTDDESDIPF